MVTLKHKFATRLLVIFLLVLVSGCGNNANESAEDALNRYLNNVKSGKQNLSFDYYRNKLGVDFSVVDDNIERICRDFVFNIESISENKEETTASISFEYNDLSDAVTIANDYTSGFKNIMELSPWIISDYYTNHVVRNEILLTVKLEYKKGGWSLVEGYNGELESVLTCNLSGYLD